MNARALVLAALVFGAGCNAERLTFRCATDDRCGPSGICVVGYCAFPAQSCSSGYRYDESAGSLHSQCVVLDDGGMGDLSAQSDLSLDLAIGDQSIPPDMVAVVDMTVIPDLVGGLPPRLISPASTATVTSRRPKLHWELPGTAMSPQIDLCRDRACTTPTGVTVMIDAGNTSGTPMTDLPQGVIFWRVRANGLAGFPLSSATWEMWVGKVTAPLDLNYGSVLDVNGDGFADVLVGASEATDGNGNTGAGRAYLYLGQSAGGVNGSTPQLLDGRDGQGGDFGHSVASAGDINGDGFADVIVGADYATDKNGNSRAGRAYLYLGGPTGLNTSTPQLLDGRDGALAYFGSSVASAGDVDGDGYGDVVVGANAARDSIGNAGAGRAYLFRGGPNGLDTTNPQLLDGRDGATAGFGNSVAGAGDINGDGYADVIVGAAGAKDASANMNAGRAYIYSGGPSGLVTNSPQLLDGRDGVNGYFGVSVAGAGDVNGDGYADVIVGSPRAGQGKAYLFPGGSGGVNTSTPQALTTTDSGLAPGAFVGDVVSGAGDVNGDGYADVIIAAPAADDTMGDHRAGRAHLFLGALTTGLNTASPILLESPSSGTNGGFASGVAIAGDVDGDNYADVIVGAAGAGGGATPPGGAYLFRGASGGLLAENNPQALDGRDGAGSNFGNSVAERHRRPSRRQSHAPTQLALSSRRRETRAW